MDRALANNPDLRIAALRIAQSKARLDQAGGDKLPSLSMPIQMDTTYPEFGASRGNANGINVSRSTNQLSLKGNWRPDIWGDYQTSSMYESAELQLLRATYQRDDMQRNVAANVTIAYIEYLSLNDRLRVARDIEKSLGEMLASVNTRLKVGDATITEMEQQKAAVYSVRSTLPVLGQQREIILNRLASLVGSMPVAMNLSHNGLNSVRFPMVIPGVPSALLLRRPDVRAMESRLLAADADIDVARARVLPPLDLSAQVGYGSIYMSQLFMPQALFWNSVANLTVSIFDSGKRAKEVEFAQAVHEELLETYVRVIYDAVREVDDSLSAISFMGKRLDAQSMAADASLRAWNYSQEAFMSGAVDYLAILDTQRSYQRNLDDLHSIRLERYRGLVNLFSALGGGVSSGDALPGSGLRPAAMADEIDYGAVLTASDTTQKESYSPNKNGGNASGYGMKSAQSLMLAGTLTNRALAEKVDWAGSSLHSQENLWLVELTGVYDRGAILPAWRDLSSRFPARLEKFGLLPQRQGVVMVNKKERASWYRLYIATFPDKTGAEEFCTALRAGQQSCTVVSAASIKGKGDFIASPQSPENTGEQSELSTNKSNINTSNQSGSLTSSPELLTPPPPAKESGSASVPLRLDPLLAKSSESNPKPASITPGKEQFSGIDWSAQQFWLVELSDAHDRAAIASAWRNLLTNFPVQMKGRTILPRRQFSSSDPKNERPPLYQLFVAKFAQQQMADEFCAMLRTDRQRCGVVSSQSLAINDGKSMPTGGGSHE